MQVVKIHQRGNSLGITIPHAYLRDLCWGAGDHLILEVKGQSLEARAVRQHVPACTQVQDEALEAADGGAQG